MTIWKMKMDPSHYLSRHPHGPNSDLARTVLAEQNEEYRKKLEQVTEPLARATEVLIRHLGCDVPSEGDSVGEANSVPAVCRRWFLRCHPGDIPISYGWDEFTRAENRLCGQMVRKFGVRLNLYGTLGAPLDVWKFPKYWKRKSHPADYLRRNATRGKREMLNLAKAAIAPIEDAVDNELVTIVNQLQLRVLASSSPYADDVFCCALDHAYTQIVYGRYEGKGSMQHYNAIRYWLQNLRFDEPAETSQIKLAQECELRPMRNW